ncbi:Methyltransferase FkbM domain-containing protein [Caenorhabditis elegans]|uniref:Methyltransferase FkbM domain-containing protein n=1 Tax=Caenorhabditis elegans TaxID=6239 RepID=O16235_CAEEL|nr:Methyltransferase FkbM domain-containing protein [Caenorhabditis elegans]CCD64329.1 Methyltransferase FkbM domain-containing protein [Caenorhabditis elegans]|eukprot:NP_504860.1 Uncharacterized protein CELE_F07G11.1 [Caenorhabditis elegans]
MNITRLNIYYYFLIRRGMCIGKQDVTLQIGLIRRLFSYALLVVFIFLVYYFMQPNSNKLIFKAFRDCVFPKLLPLKGQHKEFWYSFTNITKQCNGLPEYNALDIRPAPNRAEVKYIALPNKKEQLTMVTLGIGHDVKAEIRLKELYPNIDFHGSDPSNEINRDLYENKLGGKYYQYAVSGEKGMKNSRVYREEYKEEITEHVGAEYFLKNFVRKDRVDILWIDIEGNEFSFLEQIHNGGTIDKEGIKICQINVELHKDLLEKPEGEMEKFHDFIFKILEDGKYISINPYFVEYLKYRFIRLFLVNVGDNECTNLYLK